MTASLTIHSHGTPSDLYDALARVFPESQHDQTRWVTVVADGVTLTFFASHATAADPQDEDELTDADYDLAETIA